MTSYSRRQKLKRIKLIDFLFPVASLFILFRETLVHHNSFFNKQSYIELNKDFLDPKLYLGFIRQPIIVNFLEGAISTTNISQFDTISPSVEQSLTMADLDLIELLWRQDIDLGVSKESFDNKSKNDPLQDDIFQQKISLSEIKVDSGSQFNSFEFTIDNETGELEPNKNINMCVENEYSNEDKSQNALCSLLRNDNLPLSFKDFYKESQIMLNNLTKQPRNVDYEAEKRIIMSSWIEQTMNNNTFNESIFHNIDELFNNSILLSPSHLIGNNITSQSDLTDQTSKFFPDIDDNSHADSIPIPYNGYTTEIKKQQFDIGLSQQFLSIDPSCNNLHMETSACSIPIDNFTEVPFENISVIPFDSNTLLGIDKSLNTFDANIFLNDIINNEKENFEYLNSLKEEKPENPLFQLSLESLDIDTSLDEYQLNYNSYDNFSSIGFENPFDEIKLQNFTYDNFLALNDDSFEQLLDTTFQQDDNISSSFVDISEMGEITKNERKKRSTRTHHNHTYATAIGQPTKKQQLQMKLHQKELESKRGRDVKQAAQLGLDFLEIIECSVEKFIDICDTEKFNPQQIQLIKDIRRRGKNKQAAQNCRKRKYEELSSIGDANDELRKKVEHLRTQNLQLTEERDTYTLASNYLNKKVFRSLRDNNGNPFNPNLFQLKQSADGQHLFLTNITITK